VGFIEDGAPHLFTRVMKDGSRFKCSDSFVRKYLRNKLGWSERHATRAAQKLPENHQEILTNSFLREAYIIRDHAIPDALRVNTDQTQTVYQQGTKATWNKKGAKQVSTVGQDEKWAFTLIPSISASGVLLPMQAIYMGKTMISCPTSKSPLHDEAMELGFKLEPSMTTTYWSTQATMKSLMNGIIAPYFEQTKEDLGLPSSQCSIWKIDCWSVHKSDEFMTWMKKKHRNIIVVFVPGSCTGVWQPLDVGIQQVMKQSMKRSAHRDIVDEATVQLVARTSVGDLKLDTKLGTLRDRLLGWVVNAIHDINNKELITKASTHQTLNSIPNVHTRLSRCATSENSTSRKPA